MRVTHLSLTNFRNYRRLELDLPDGPILLHGDNAQGKTNLLESIYYLATTRSPHANNGQQLINWDAGSAGDAIVVGRLIANLETREGPRQIELRLISERNGETTKFRREALVDRRKMRLMDLLGKLMVVIFLPQDLQIITGSPSQRRRYIDIILCQTDRDYCRHLSTYKKVLDQRNALLRSIMDSGSGLEVLPIYNEKLVEAGSEVILKRAQFISSMADIAQQIHFEDLTSGRERLAMDYIPRLAITSSTRISQENLKQAKVDYEWLLQQNNPVSVANRFTESLVEVRKRELASGMTQIGPHRDDWSLSVDGRELNAYGSRGQQRTALLAIKLSEIKWMASKTGETPLLLLDEVVAELDEQRRSFLLKAVQDAPQSILTATDPTMFSDDFLHHAQQMTVTDGMIEQD